MPQNSHTLSLYVDVYFGENYLVKMCHFTLQGLVLIITIMREAIEEIRCYVRDKEMNSQIYSKLSTRGNV